MLHDREHDDREGPRNSPANGEAMMDSSAMLRPGAGSATTVCAHEFLLQQAADLRLRATALEELAEHLPRSMSLVAEGALIDAVARSNQP